MKPRGLCRLIGHRYYRGKDAFMYPLHCERCGDDDTYGDIEPAVIERIAYWAWHRPRLWIGIRVERFAEWLRCPYCHGRFGRHDKDECIPF